MKPEGSAENFGSTLNVSEVSTPTAASAYIIESKEAIPEEYLGADKEYLKQPRK